jgi:hypothetical protein
MCAGTASLLLLSRKKRASCQTRTSALWPEMEINSNVSRTNMMCTLADLTIHVQSQLNLTKRVGVATTHRYESSPGNLQGPRIKKSNVSCNQMAIKLTRTHGAHGPCDRMDSEGLGVTATAKHVNFIKKHMEAARTTVVRETYLKPEGTWKDSRPLDH